MLSGITLSNEFETIEMSYGHQDNSYEIVEVDGLGPPSASINHSDYTILDGAVYHNSKVDPRNIVITVEFNPDYRSNETVKDLRRRLYRATQPKSMVRLELLTDGTPELWIDGYVETNDPAIFSKNPQVQISIIATDPYFNGMERRERDFTQQDSFVFNNPGDVETGFEVFFYLNQDTRWVDLVNHVQDPLPRIRVRPLEADLSPGRSIRVNTSPGHKEVVLRDSNRRTLHRLLGETIITNGWPSLVPGRNLLRMNAAGTDIAHGMIRFWPKYGGY